MRIESICKGEVHVIDLRHVPSTGQGPVSRETAPPVGQGLSSQSRWTSRGQASGNDDRRGPQKRDRSRHSPGFRRLELREQATTDSHPPSCPRSTGRSLASGGYPRSPGWLSPEPPVRRMDLHVMTQKCRSSTHSVSGRPRRLDVTHCTRVASDVRIHDHEQRTRSIMRSRLDAERQGVRTS